jgi:hypothetical protein
VLARARSYDDLIDARRRAVARDEGHGCPGNHTGHPSRGRDRSPSRICGR